MRILIAEDDFASRILLDAVLVKWGYEVVIANDGEQAWNILRSDVAPQIAILDWMMPKRSGVELCALVRGSQRELSPYIVMLTAKGQKEDVSEGLDAGADDYLIKPFDLVELGARLRVARRSLDWQRQLVESRRAIHYQALHDLSTGALNRGAALDALSHALTGTTSVTAMLVAIDRHKELQQREGVPQAEAAVRAVVQAIRATVKDAAIGRYETDQLLVVLQEPLSPAVALADRVRGAIVGQELAVAAGIDSRLTVSVGLAEWDGAASMELLLCYADTALYSARAEGDTVDIFSMYAQPPT
jgi:two-component system, cell cycle response regulator